jgi:membrane associated rhomboid family serine protease
VLRWVAEAAPHPWFPGTHAERAGLPRDGLDEPLWILRQANLVQVADWVKGRGQGFKLTPEGERAAGRPNPVPVPPPRNQRPPAPIPDEADNPLRDERRSVYAAGETARRSLFDPPPAVVTPVLLVVNVLWFVYGGVIAFQSRGVTDYLKGGNDPVISPILVRIGALSAPELLNGDWWRLLTCCFVHVGLFHLLGNMVTLGMLGTVAEGVWGRWRFALIYLLSGLAGSVTAIALHPQTEAGGVARDLLLAGASGSLWGVTAAVIAWLIRNLKYLPTASGSEWVRKLLVVAAMNVVISFAPGISLEAHAGGGAGGVLVAVCLARIRGDRRETAAAVVGLLLVVSAFAALLAVAMTRSDDWQAVRERQTQRVKQRQLLPPPADAPPRRE